jgi:hypothetical protein
MTAVDAISGNRTQFWGAAMFLGIVTILSVAAFNVGSDARSKAELAEAALIEKENRTFCVGLGVSPQTDSYTRCANGLAEIRRLQKERWDADAMGIL